MKLFYRMRIGVLTLAAPFFVLSASAQNWDESTGPGGDAGETLVTSHDLTALSYTSINGQLDAPGDVDIYKITILNNTNFSATTVKASYGGQDLLDSWLYLFDSAGNAVYSNSESPAGDPGNPGFFANALLPKVGDVGLNPSGHGPTATGVYYLAVGHWDEQPLDASSDEVFENPFDFGEVYTRINGPISGAGALDSWDGGGEDAGDYVVTISGTSLPVELTRFDAVADGQDILLQWETAGETNNAGFDVEAAGTDGVFASVGYVEGAGTTTASQHYSYRVVAPNRANRFRLRQVNTDGSSSYSAIVSASVSTPGVYTARPAYPNPFTERTTVEVSVPTAQSVDVEVFSVLGQRIQTLFSGYMKAGETEALEFDAAGLPTGFYLIKVRGERFEDAQLVTLLR